MRVLLLGSGGREHALAWKIAQSPLLSELICAPGNPGIAQHARLVSARIDVPSEVVALARTERIDLVVVGPEAPLVKGVADALEDAGIAVFGPRAGAAALEGSKAFAKEVMRAANIPTAEGRSFTDASEAERYARERGAIVVKADGLAAGKGVIVARTADEGVAAVKALSALGEAGKTLVLEELLDGEEVSVIALCDGERYVLLPPAQDHKRVGDGDTGPNTGGMGAYCPAPFLDDAALARAGDEVIAPALAEMRRRQMPFRGALYAGLMLTPRGPRVLEFNARFGDPETQVLMMQLGEDVLPLLNACAHGKLEARPLQRREGASIGVVVAAEGYPSSPKLGNVVELSSVNRPRSGAASPAEREKPALSLSKGVGGEGSGNSSPNEQTVQLFHAGTRLEGNRVVTSGGRVLTVCASAPTLLEARARAYAAVDGVRFRGMHFRRDIGARALPK